MEAPPSMFPIILFRILDTQLGSMYVHCLLTEKPTYLLMMLYGAIYDFWPIYVVLFQNAYLEMCRQRLIVCTYMIGSVW